MGAGSMGSFNKNSSRLHESATLVVYPKGSDGIGATRHTLSGLRCWIDPEVWQDCGGKTALLVHQMRQAVYTQQNTAGDQEKTRLSQMQEAHASLQKRSTGFEIPVREISTVQDIRKNNAIEGGQR
jgi:hypothetical protein